MYSGLSTALIIPVLDEEKTIGSVLDGVDRSLIDTAPACSRNQGAATATLACAA